MKTRIRIETYQNGKQKFFPQYRWFGIWRYFYEQEIGLYDTYEEMIIHENYKDSVKFLDEINCNEPVKVAYVDYYC